MTGGFPKLTWGVGMTLLAPDGQSSVYFQPGDDAQSFLDEYETLERYLGPDRAMAELWTTYGHLAEPIDERIAA